MATRLTSTERLIDDAIDGLFDYEPVAVAMPDYLARLLPGIARDRLTLAQKRQILDAMLADEVVSLTVDDSADELLDPGEGFVPLIDDDLLDRVLADPQAVALIEQQLQGTMVAGERLLEMPRARQRDTVSAIMAAVGYFDQTRPEGEDAT